MIEMKSGDVREFIDHLIIQDEMIKYQNHLYYFYGIRYNKERNVYYTSIDKFGETLYQFEEELYYYESADMSDCLEHLLSDKYWNGKNFYEIESFMTWVDG